MKSRVYLYFPMQSSGIWAVFHLRNTEVFLLTLPTCAIPTKHRGTWVLHQLNSPHKSEGFWGSQKCAVPCHSVGHVFGTSRQRQKKGVKIQARMKGPEQKKHQNLNSTASKLHTMTWSGTGYWLMPFLIFLLKSLYWRRKNQLWVKSPNKNPKLWTTHSNFQPRKNHAVS